jgi:hypothetical protein
MHAEYKCVMPFWIDTEAYSDRDREMFVCGVEFEMLRVELLNIHRTVTRTIHVENESRTRMMACKLGRKAVVEPSGVEGRSYFTSPAMEPRQCGD